MPKSVLQRRQRLSGSSGSPTRDGDGNLHDRRAISTTNPLAGHLLVGIVALTARITFDFNRHHNPTAI